MGRFAVDRPPAPETIVVPGGHPAPLRFAFRPAWPPYREFSRNQWSNYWGAGQSTTAPDDPATRTIPQGASITLQRCDGRVQLLWYKYIREVFGDFHLAHTRIALGFDQDPQCERIPDPRHPNAVAHCRPSLLPRPSPASLDGIVAARHRSIPGLFQPNQMSPIREGSSALTLDDTLVVISTDQFLPRRCQPPSGCGGRSEYHGGAHVGHSIPHTLRSVHVIG